jgi:hypothetical protein
VLPCSGSFFVHACEAGLLTSPLWIMRNKVYSLCISHGPFGRLQARASVLLSGVLSPKYVYVSPQIQGGPF